MSVHLVGEMIGVAFNAIWSNRLRSFLTILGNIVAVASIVTLVSLIEGINDEVAGVIVTEVGADTFMVDRTGLITSEDELERRRSNPRITLDDRDAIRSFSEHVDAVMAQGREGGEVRYRDEVLEQATIQGVTSEFARFPTFTAERGRLMTPTEISRNRNVVLLGCRNVGMSESWKYRNIEYLGISESCGFHLINMHAYLLA